MKKEDIRYVFEQNPELKNIGTKTQYSKYLKTVFPESQTKGIVYHGTSAEFKQFKGSSFQYFFTKDIELANINAKFKRKGNPRIIRALLNSKNPWDYALEGEGREVANFHFDEYSKKGYDTMINKNEIAVYNPNQIHILGSKQDLKGFKEYIEGTSKGNSLEQKIISGIFILSFLVGLFFLYPTITGNTILNGSTNKHNVLSSILIIFGITGFLINKMHRK